MWRCCMQVPVAVGGRVVTWIDSKATFGDERIHAKQLEAQYRTYVNRCEGVAQGMLITLATAHACLQTYTCMISNSMCVHWHRLPPVWAWVTSLSLWECACIH